MRRERGWGLSGARVVGSRPGGHCKNISMLGAIAIGRRPLLMTQKGGVGRSSHGSSLSGSFDGCERATCNTVKLFV
jgi:hypothetical protein